MDAKRLLLAAGCALCLTTGCSLLNPQPKPQTPKAEPDRDREQPQVARGAPQSAGAAAATQPVTDRIEEWIAQMPDLRTRVAEGGSGQQRPGGGGDPWAGTFAAAPRLEPVPGPATPDDGGLREAADEQPVDGSDTDADGEGAQPLQPPTVRDVAVYAAPNRARANAASRELPEARVNGPEIAAAAGDWQELLDAMLAQGFADTHSGELDRRLARIMAGDYAAASEPLPMMSAEQGRLMKSFLQAFVALRQMHDGNLDVSAEQLATALRELEQSSVSVAGLEIGKLEICRAVRGFGQYTLFDPPTFVAGRANEFVTYCELRNFQSEQTEAGEWVCRFGMKTTVLNRIGDTVFEVEDEKIVDRSRTRRRDCFIPRLIRLPASLSPGEYVVKVTIDDRIGQRVAEQRATFRLVARP